MNGHEYASRIAAYVAEVYGPRGLQVYREVGLGKSIIGKNRRVDVTDQPPIPPRGGGGVVEGGGGRCVGWGGRRYDGGGRQFQGMRSSGTRPGEWRRTRTSAR